MSGYHSMEYDILMKTVILGDSGVGKSSLLHQYADNEWSPVYVATIGVDFKIDTFETNGKVVKLQMWDTAGQERFKTICAAYYRGAHCIMLVYDVTNRESFDNIKHWMREVETYARPNIPMILVGNKADKHDERVITPMEADEFAERHNMEHVVASAKSAHNVHHAFRTLVGRTMNSDSLFNDVKKREIIRLQALSVESERQPTCIQRFLKFFGAF